MNAAKAKKNPAKVKGAVLIMILAVMTVMIILLAGSIAVVYSSHNRAFVKYTESQGYYTARSILDNFFSELSASTDKTDSKGTAVGTYYQLDIEHNTTKANPMCMGRAVELDLYKAFVDVKDSSGNYYDWFKDYCDKYKDGLNSQLQAMGITTTALTGSTLYDKVATYYVNLKYDALSDTTKYENFYLQYKTIDKGDVKTGMQADTIVYNVTSLEGFGSGKIDTDGDGTADTEGDYGKLSDNGSGKAWITIQVIERLYDFGEGSNYADKFKAGKRSEDHIVAKVTSHVIYDGEEITTSQIWYNNPPPIVDSDTGLSTQGPINDDASITGVGDVATLTKNLSIFSNDPTFSGNVYFEGSVLQQNNDTSARLEKGDVFFIGGTYKSSVNKFKDVNPGTVFYANRFQLFSSNSLIDNDEEINLIANTLEIHGSKKVKGRIFAENFNTTFDTTDGDDLKTTTKEIIPNQTLNDSIAAGNITFANNTAEIYGDVHCNYLGVPADRVYAEVDNTNNVITFKIDYKGNGTKLGDSDSARVEKLMKSGKIYVYQGIKIINSAKQEVLGTYKKKEWSNEAGAEVEVTKTEYTYVNDYVSYTKGGETHTDFTIDEIFVKPSDTYSLLMMGGDEYKAATNYKIKFDFSAAGGTIVDNTGSKRLNINYNAPKSANEWTLNDRYYKEFKLPTGVKLIGASDNKITLPTHRSLYGNYYYNETIGGSTPGKTFDKDTGAFTMDTSNPNFHTKFLQEHAITAEALLAKIDINSPVDITKVPDMPFKDTAVTMVEGGDEKNGITIPKTINPDGTAKKNVISSSGYIAPPTGNPLNDYKKSIFYIDARESDIEIQLGDGTTNAVMCGAFIVYGDKHVTVTVPGTKTGGTDQTVYLGASDSKFIFTTEEIFSGNSSTNFVIGEAKAGVNGGKLTSAPNIDWYFSKNIGTVSVATGGGIENAPSNSNDTNLSGYITAPTAAFSIDTNANGMSRKTYYYKDEIPSNNSKYTICGSIFCKQYKGGQHAGVCFIPRDDGYTDDGSKPMLNKVGMYRTRS